MTTSIFAPTFHLLRKILKYSFLSNRLTFAFFHPISIYTYINQLRIFALCSVRKLPTVLLLMLLHVIASSNKTSGQRQPNFINFDSDIFGWAYFKQHGSMKQLNVLFILHLYVYIRDSIQWVQSHYKKWHIQLFLSSLNWFDKC